MNQHVVFLGLGYIGLPTAVLMARAGLQVTGVDVNTERVAAVNAGKIPTTEPGLAAELDAALRSGCLRADSEVPNADAYIIAVPTPFDGNRRLDTSFIDVATDSIAPHLRPGSLVILESTVPPRTTERMAQRILQRRPDLQDDEGKELVLFAHCPERILPGNALQELKTNDRVIGGTTPEASASAAELYRVFCDGEMLITDDRTAEMTKLTENAFRDVNIAFANELSLVCDTLDIDVWELIELANHHPRVNILNPGPGVGGHCIAVDPWFIVESDPANSRLIRTAREVNDSKPAWVEAKVKELVNLYHRPTIAVLGLAFKANIGDLRESPSLSVAVQLNALDDAKLLIVEPNITDLPSQLAGAQLTDLNSAVDAADIVVLLVDHREFTNLTSEQLRGKAVLDTKGLWR